MLEPTIDESILDSSTTIKNQQRKTWKLSSRQFLSFWKRNSREAVPQKENRQQKDDLMDLKIIDCKIKNASTNRTSFNFLRNMKKRINFKPPAKYKSKQVEKEMEAAGLSDDVDHSTQLIEDEQSFALNLSGNTVELKTDRDNLSNINLYCIKEASDVCDTSLRNVDISSSSNGSLQDHLSNTNGAQSRNTTYSYGMDVISIPSSESQIHEHQHSETIRTINTNLLSYENLLCNENPRLLPEISDAVTNDSKVKASLTEELLKLSRYGWYWGPISGNEADAKLLSEPDGAFLVRDSSDDRYVLTLSFKSSGKLLHTRMEHSGGLFSLCNQSDTEGFTSVAALINHSMNSSQSAVFCYSRPKYPGYPSFPVRLTKPVSRFTQVRSLQYLCRFVIRQNTRLDNIHKLPLPKTIKGYIEEAHY